MNESQIVNQLKGSKTIDELYKKIKTMTILLKPYMITQKITIKCIDKFMYEGKEYKAILLKDENIKNADKNR